MRKIEGGRGKKRPHSELGRKEDEGVREMEMQGRREKRRKRMKKECGEGG